MDLARSGGRCMRTAVAKGLINEPGSNNCFLNSAVQVLWHLDAFRRSFRVLSAHRCTRDSCIFCALKVVFTQLEYSDHAQIAPDQLRKALVACTSYLPADDDQLGVSVGVGVNSPKHSVFALGSMADACECLESILLRLHAHLDYVLPESSASACTAPHCITHAKFAMRVQESIECACGARGQPTDYTQVIYYVATHAIVANLRTAVEAYGLPDAFGFGRALRAASCSGEDRECPAACGRRGAQLVRQLVSAPDVLGIGLVWNSASPGASTLNTLYEAIGMSLRLSDVFDSNASSLNANQTLYHLVGLVCYVGRHYATFMLHSKAGSWVLFDDSNVKEIGRSWHLVVARCIKCRFVPVLLLYSNPNSTTINPASVPQSSVQISNAELLRAVDRLNVNVPPTPAAANSGSLSRRRNERSGSASSGGGNSLERNQRMHKKTRAASGMFQARVRAAASVDNLHEITSRADADFDDDGPSLFNAVGDVVKDCDAARRRRQASLAFALGITDQPAARGSPLTARVVRARTATRRELQKSHVNVSTGGLTRHKSLDSLSASAAGVNSILCSGEDSVSIESSIDSTVSPVLANRRPPAAADTAFDPKAIEAQGFRQQFADLLAKADALLQVAAACEAAAENTEALLHFTQAAICLKQAADLPAIEQNSRLAAVNRQNVCNASVRRLHRELNQLAATSNGRLTPADSAGSDATSVTASTVASRQDSGMSTWSEGHSTASEDWTVATGDSQDEVERAYAATLTRLGPYNTLPRKPRLKLTNPNATQPYSTDSGADTDADQSPLWPLPPPTPTSPEHSSHPASPGGPNQSVVLAVRSTRRALRPDPIAIAPPSWSMTEQSAVNTREQQLNVGAVVNSPRPTLQRAQSTTPMRELITSPIPLITQLQPQQFVSWRGAPETNTPIENTTGQAQAVVARSAGSNKSFQSLRTPQMTRRAVVDVSSPTQVQPTSPVMPQLNSQLHGSDFSRSLMTQPKSGQDMQQEVVMSPRHSGSLLTPPADVKPSAGVTSKMGKKKVTFLDDLIAKQAERVRQNMAQIPSTSIPSPTHTINASRVANTNMQLTEREMKMNKSFEYNSQINPVVSPVASSNVFNHHRSPQGINWSMPAFPSKTHCQSPPDIIVVSPEADTSGTAGMGSSVANGGRSLCKLCQRQMTICSDSYCNACTAYMAKLQSR